MRKRFLALFPLCSAAGAQDRLPDIAPDKLTEAQKEESRTFLEDRKTPVFGPFVPLLRSPQLMLQAMAMGDYLRYHNALPPKINEFVNDHERRPDGAGSGQTVTSGLVKTLIDQRGHRHYGVPPPSKASA
jgi:hypothetical protein